MRSAHLGRIEVQLFSDLVEMHFQRIARLGCAVSPFRPTWGLVRKNARTLKLVTWYVVSNSLQCAGVEGAGNSIASVGAAIEKRFEVHRRDGAVFFHTSLHLHEDGMPPTMAVKDFFARERE